LSVLKNKRGLSKLEFYHNARKMRKEITKLVLRDFGIHSRGKAFKEATNSQQPEGYYDELIEEFSRSIRQLLRNLILNITAGNTIYPTNHDELILRRRYQTGAIINCEQLLQEILYLEDVIPVKASMFIPYIEQIQFEIKLLKGWRKSNNKLEEQVAARNEKKRQKLSQYDDFNLVADVDNLSAAFKKCMRGVAWKESIQRYEANALKNIMETRHKLYAGENIQSGFVEFTLRERGKVRHIKSVHISERVVQKCLCDEVLVPLLTDPLIHDNGASIKGKGVHFALRRLICHLSCYYRRQKTNIGYALLIDFKKFFDNIDHETLFYLIEKRVNDERVRDLVHRFVSVFGAGKSLGLGSQISQISAIYYPDTLDHFIKEKLRIKCYGRYMDDMYLIHADKAYLQYCLSEIKAVCATLKITVNEKKSRIVKLSDGIQFLKGKYVLLESGKILRLPQKDSTKRMRRKLKKFKILLDENKMSFKDIYTSFQSWRGTFKKRFNACYCISRMDALYNKLFIQCRDAAMEGNDGLYRKEKWRGGSSHKS